METMLASINWTQVLVSFVPAYGLGWYWYSDTGFGVPWRAGKGSAVWQAPMWMPMLTQAVATLLLAILIDLATADGDMGHAILVALTIAAFIKANGLFGGKSKYAITVETTYVVAMAAIMLAVQLWL